jgi:excinuclease ABC A subunit
MSTMNTPPTDVSVLEIVGADANNLHDIDCSFPLKGLSAVIGVSGSGKSSLLQHVIAAEAARRNSLFHGLARQETGESSVRAYVGPAPAALFVGQRPFRPSSRTTVGTSTGLLGDFRILFLAEGTPVAEDGTRISPASPDLYAEWLVNQYRGKATIWTVPLRWVKSDGRQAAARLVAAGITKGILRSETDSPKRHETGRKVDLQCWRALPEGRLHALEAVVDTLSIDGPKTLNEVTSLLRTAWDISGSDVIVELHDTATDVDAGPLGSLVDGARHRVHPTHRGLFRTPDRHLLSFNAPEHEDSGACPICKGIGRHMDITLETLVVAPEKSLHQGALALWTPKNYKHLNIQHKTIEGLRGRQGLDPDVPWRNLPPAARDLILDGTGDDLIQGINPQTGKKDGASQRFEGFRPAILRRVETTAGAKALSSFINEGPCPACHGSRWSPTARALHAAGKSLPDWLSLPLLALAEACRTAEDKAETPIGRQALQRLALRAEMLSNLGLGHLSADRGMLTVSDGESRRLQIGATLALSAGDLMLLLDEPARGLHEKDLGPMIAVLKDLGKRHCVLLNEHRGPVVDAADRVLTLGPGAGTKGGCVVSIGAPVHADHKSPNSSQRAGLHGWMNIQGATMHNVRDQDVRLPLGAISAIVGVSGSGKSSFARGVLIPALLKGQAMSGDAPEAEDLMKGRWSSVDGIEAIRQVHVLHQRVPPRNRRSLVVTMTGAQEAIAASFAATPEAQRAGLTAKDFSLNGGLGRCPTCLGTGADPRDEAAPCVACGGRCYREAALGPTVAGLNMAETLAKPVSALAVEWAAGGAKDLAHQHGPLFSTMQDLGLGHVALGRRVDSLSGGEVQRLRVALTLAGSDRRKGHLFLLDEPAAGLHRDDAERLMEVLERMVDGGQNTVIIIEHNMHVVRAVDWLVEFGPGAGPNGGRVVAAGTPADLATCSTPTGHALSGALLVGQHGGRPWSALTDEPDAEGPLLERLASGDLDKPPSKSAPQTDQLLAGRRLWEVGDLNLEVGKLVLDDRDGSLRKDREHLLEQWRNTPDARLVVNPALPDMRLWGTTLPRSTARVLLDRLSHMGLALRDDRRDIITNHPAVLRAALPASNASDEARAAALTQALAIGGGFVELEHGVGHVLATLKTVPLDLDKGLIGPQVLTPGHLSRFRPEGACPACRGQGKWVATRADLLIRPDAHGSAQDPETILTSQAASLLKGLWRTMARPFFRRLEEEGLADPARLNQDLLFGYWRRPDHGSFLKSPKDDPNEVGSWLCWDGLLSVIWAELPRTKDKDWAQAVKDDRYDAPCPLCNGSGHGASAQLVRLGDQTLVEWAKNGTVDELRDSLASFSILTHRQERTRDRLYKCLTEPGLLGADAKGHTALADAVRRTFVTGRP